MKNMNILIACEMSGIVRDSFTALGHNAWSCDLVHSERPGFFLISTGVNERFFTFFLVFIRNRCII